MYFEKVDPAAYQTKRFHTTKIQANLEEFLAMECPTVKCCFAPGEYSSVASAQSTYNQAIKRLHYDLLRAIVINGELFLVNNLEVSDLCFSK